jgi:serine protease
MKKYFYLGTLMSLLFASCQKSSESDSPQQNPQTPISQQKLDEGIKQQVLSTGIYDWNNATDETIWSALQYGDDVLSIGFRPADMPTDLSATIHKIDIKTGAWADTKRELLQLIYQEEKKLHPDLQFKNIEAYEEAVLPVIDVHVKSLSTIKLLRSLKTIRYVDPIG